MKMNVEELALRHELKSSFLADASVFEVQSASITANRERFEALFLLYKDKIFNYQLGLVGNVEDACDLSQATLIRAWEKLPTLRDESRLTSWLYMIARNVVYDYWRRTKKVLTCSWEDLDDKQSVMSVQGSEEFVEMTELVKFALDELAPKYRDCLVLHAVYGCSKQEIAQRIGISRESVTTYLCSARRQFRQAYNQLSSE